MGFFFVLFFDFNLIFLFLFYITFISILFQETTCNCNYTNPRNDQFIVSTSTVYRTEYNEIQCGLVFVALIRCVDIEIARQSFGRERTHNPRCTLQNQYQDTSMRFGGIAIVIDTRKNECVSVTIRYAMHLKLHSKYIDILFKVGWKW